MKSTTRKNLWDKPTESSKKSGGTQQQREAPSTSRSTDVGRQKIAPDYTATNREGRSSDAAGAPESSHKKQTVAGSRTMAGSKNSSSNVCQQERSSRSATERRQPPVSSAVRSVRKTGKEVSAANRRRQPLKKGRDTSEDTSSSSQEMTTTSASSMLSDATLTSSRGGNIVMEQETNLDLDQGNRLDDCTDDENCTPLLASPKSDANIRNDLAEPTTVASGQFDDDELNFKTPAPIRLNQTRHLSTDDDEFDGEDDFNELSNGAALTMADDDQLTTLHTEDISFVVYPLGRCEFDETQLVSTTSTRAIQKCILRLSNKPSQEEAMCWGLGQSQPILMRLLEDHIQFTDIASQNLLSSQPIQSIKSWAVDDDNNFAFVIEEGQQANSADATIDYALLNGPSFVCYVLRSLDDDDMSCRVAAKLNEEITRYREQLSSRISKSTKLKQMIVVDPDQAAHQTHLDDQTDLDAEDLDDQLEAANEFVMRVKYIGKVQVLRPMGIDVLNVAIDRCLADASDRSLSREPSTSSESSTSGTSSPLIDAKLHVSPSSVIVEEVATGSIIVECRIRYLTFMGISRRDIRWCGFIMQNTTNKTFVAHCFECHPTAAYVCDAIQASCSRMYEKMLRGQKTKKQHQQDATTSIMPNGSKIRDTLARTLSRIKLTPII